MSETLLGTVLEGPHQGRECVLKRARPDTSERALAERFMAREALLLGAVKHPCVVELFDAFERDGETYLALERIEGVSLATLLTTFRKLEEPVPAPLAYAILIQLLATLGALHAARAPDGRPLKLRHCDLSPNNVMLARNGEVKLLDFGISQWFEDPDEFPDGMSIGTPGYLAPEQVCGGPSTDRADVFAAAILAVMLIGGKKSPFRRGQMQQSLLATLHGLRPPVEQMLPDAPPALCTLLEQCLSTFPEDRPSAARASLEALTHLEMAGVEVATTEQMNTFLTEFAALRPTDSIFGMPASAPLESTEPTSDDVPVLVDADFDELPFEAQGLVRPSSPVPPEAARAFAAGVEAILRRDFDKAYRSFQSATQIDPSHREAKANLLRLEELGVREAARPH